jgi:hypothetical protein
MARPRTVVEQYGEARLAGEASLGPVLEEVRERCEVGSPDVRLDSGGQGWPLQVRIDT